jgi:hypothetical protein
MHEARHETETYTPERELLRQLHARLDLIIEVYRREKITDDLRQPAVRLADGSRFRPLRVIRDYIAPDGRVITLDTINGPRVMGRVSAPTLTADRLFSVSIKIAHGQRGRAVGPDGEVSGPPTQSPLERYRVVEDLDEPHVYGISGESANRPLDPAAAEQLLWLVQNSTPVPAEG